MVTTRMWYWSSRLRSNFLLAALRPYDATNLAKELYTSNQNASDAAGFGIKFTSPIVANGKVFIGTGHDPDTAANPQGELDVYGLK